MTFIEIGRRAEHGDQIAQLYWMALATLGRTREHSSLHPEDIHARVVNLVNSAYGDPSKNS